MKSKSSGKDHRFSVSFSEDKIEFLDVAGNIIARVSVDTITNKLKGPTESFCLIFEALTQNTYDKNIAIVSPSASGV